MIQFLLVLNFALLQHAAPSLLPGPAVQSPDALARLAWLTGCWTQERLGRRIEEHWMKPAGMMMMGMSRTVIGGTITDFEFLLIRSDSSGTIHYVAFPAGQKETWFKLTNSDMSEFVFENPDHDFPQRIRYRRIHADSLVARIEGTVNGKSRAVDFSMRRTLCEE